MLGKVLRDARLKAGLSQKDLSVMLGYDTPQFISNFERSVSFPPVSKLKTIAKILEIDADSLATLVINEMVAKRRNTLWKSYKKN